VARYYTYLVVSQQRWLVCHQSITIQLATRPGKKHASPDELRLKNRISLLSETRTYGTVAAVFSNRNTDRGPCVAAAARRGTRTGGQPGFSAASACMAVRALSIKPRARSRRRRRRVRVKHKQLA
jgi:hypothetical protein